MPDRPHVTRTTGTGLDPNEAPGAAGPGGAAFDDAEWWWCAAAAFSFSVTAGASLWLMV